ncbi:MAG: hypothetical protein D6798_07320 [Deltaproteobacteria bacterium]|nr:MAG: hypothetical protein D6798_07320 [Deltaproteobacteria bacterium]
MSRLRRCAAALSLAGLLVAGPAHAKKDRYADGVPVQVTVVDASGEPVPTAVIRHPDEADRHRVNSLTGTWEESKLYLPDGSELIFKPGMSIQLEVSAPGYMTQIIQYDIRKRKNNVQVTLQELNIDDSDIDEPLLQFGRDKPRETGTSGPAN